MAFEPKTMLCGIDFSPASQVAVAYAALLAKAYEARVRVLHAHHVELPAYLGQEQWAALNRELEAAKASVEDHMREFAGPALAAAGVSAEYAAMDEPPVDALLKAMEDEQPDLVVLGSHGHNRLNQFLLGSVSASVLRETAAPLLVTRQKAGATPTEARIEHVLCPVNYTPAARAGLQAAAALAGRMGATLTILHSMEQDGDEGVERQRVCQWVPEQVKADCTWEAAPVVKGPAAERIVAAAAEMGADLIALGGRRRAFLTASILGATTERVVRHAQCPVLTVVAT